MSIGAVPTNKKYQLELPDYRLRRWNKTEVKIKRFDSFSLFGGRSLSNGHQKKKVAAHETVSAFYAASDRHTTFGTRPAFKDLTRLLFPLA